jgi:hypothetical protein
MGISIVFHRYLLVLFLVFSGALSAETLTDEASGCELCHSENKLK